MRIAVNKENNINTGDYSGVRNGVQLEIDNVLVKDFYKVQKLLRHISYQIYCLNVVGDLEDMTNITKSKKEVKEFFQFLSENKESIERDLNINILELEKMGYDI